MIGGSYRFRGERTVVLLSVSDIKLSFGVNTVLENVSFSVNEGDKLGVIGVNGAGKTSLFRVITGEYTPDTGEVYLPKGKTLGLLRQDVAVMCDKEETTLFDYMTDAFPELLALEREIADAEAALLVDPTAVSPAALSALHERFHREGGTEFRSRCRGMLLHMGFREDEIDRRVSSLSGGQHTRLALSRLLCRTPDLLLLDEPTNHLDIDALLWLEDFLASYPKTLILISHDRYFLDRVTTKTLEVARGHAKLYPGNYTKYKAQRELEDAAQEKAYKEQRKVIERIEKNIQFQRECSMEHNFVTIRSKEKQLAKMQKVEALPPPPKEMRLLFRASPPSGNEVLSFDRLSFSYGETPLISHLTHLLRRDERLLVLGENGSGKSTLLRLAVGALRPLSGRLTLGSRVEIGYYDQENRFASESHTLFDELRTAYPKKTDFELREVLALFLFTGEDVFRPVSALSGGERARLTLAKLILKEVNLLVLDEPTNHLDIASREVLEKALCAFPGTVLAVSHDRYFIDRVATHILELDREEEKGARVYAAPKDGSAYAEYLASRAGRERAAVAAAKAAPPSESRLRYAAEKEKSREAKNLEKRKARAADRARALEKELELLDAELFGEAASDYKRASEIDARKNEIEEELLSLYELLL